MNIPISVMYFEMFIWSSQNFEPGTNLKQMAHKMPSYSQRWSIVHILSHFVFPSYNNFVYLIKDSVGTLKKTQGFFMITGEQIIDVNEPKLLQSCTILYEVFQI